MEKKYEHLIYLLIVVVVVAVVVVAVVDDDVVVVVVSWLTWTFNGRIKTQCHGQLNQNASLWLIP